MKTRLFKTILALTLALIALPMMGQDFMNVYFKDGTFRKFYMKNVIEITTSKFDQEGVKHGDYDYQHVTTKYDRYVYSLEDVDSITFTKIDEEKAEQNFVSAMSSIFPTVDECETIDEVESKIDQIKSAEGVADAWSDGHQLFISIIEGETISFHFNHDAVTDEPLEESASQVRELQLLKTSFQKPDGTPLKAVIANQQEKDEDRDYSQNFNRLIKDFQDCGIQVEYLPSPTIDFFYSNSKDPQNLHIYDFDIVLLSTHGGYSQLPYYKETWLGNPGIEWGPMAHSIITSEDFEMIESKSKEADDLKWKSAWKKYYATFRDWRDNSKYKDATDQHINFTYCKEKRDGNWYWVGHPELTEYFFKDIAEGQFTNPQSIFYNASCQSLKGDNGQPSYSFANVLFNERNLGVYIGYTETNFSGQRGGCEFLENMTLGYSVEVSRDRLPDWCKLETLENIEKNAGDFTEESLQIHRNTPPHHAEMEILYSDKTDVSNTSFLFPTISVPIDNDQAIFDFYQKNKVTLNGITSFSRKKNDVTVGFRYGVNPHTLIQDITGRKETTANITNGNYPFKAEITGLTPGYTYYYRAYTFDGQNYNYGETCLFKIDKYDDLKLSANSSFINNGESTTIDITGNGEYDIFNGNEKVTKVTLEGEKLTIEAIGAGESTIIVTDKKTGNTAPIEVTVWARLSIAIIGNIDLEVGDKTNVRIMSGNNDYTLDSDYPKVATPTLIGEFVSVEALSAGKATITVTDNKTDQTASFTVTVNDSTPIDIPAETIDLGLPSGTLWASYNIGATKPEEYGSYFAWGETEQKEKCGWYNYTHCNGSENTCFNLGSDISGTKYDVAHTKWGGEWCLPTLDQVKELINKCSSTWTTVNGVNGLLFTGPNGKTIFFPAAGYLGGEVLNTGSYGYYWSGGQDPKNAERAYNLAVYNGTPNWLNNYRFAGFSVRPVINGTPSYADLVLSTYDPININVNAGLTFVIVSGSGTYAVESSNEAVATVTLRGNYVDVSGVAAGTATITVIDVMSGQQKTREVTVIDNTPLPGTPAEAIDLGLPSGTLWASYNIGASKPEEYGSYLAWGETEEKDFYNENTYLYKETDIGTNIAGTIYDVAHILWGGSWQMPNKRLLQELFKCCSFEWITVNGVKGGKLTGPNGNSIFMPAGEWKVGYGSNGTQYGAYWSSEQGKGWRFYMGTNDLFSCSTYIGLLVRPVIPGKTGDIPGQAIDLGLPSGTKWASYNVGATAPDDYGGYYAWGETEEKEVYELKNYIHCDGDDKTYHNIGENIIGTEYDVATVRWGSSWHMPTKEQFEELINNCSVVYGKTQNGVYGIQYTGPNGNKIFLPATGHKIGNTYYQYRGGRYWTGQLVKWDDYVSDSMCDILSFERNTQGLNVDNDYGLRYMGLSVRPVTNE